MILALVAASAAVQGERNTQALTRTAVTQAMRTLASDLLISAQNAETGQRGYLLTQDTDYLVPFDRAQQQMPQEMDRLAATLPGDPRVVALQQAAAVKLAELQHTVDLTRAGRLAEAIAIVRTGVGREEMRRLRDATTALASTLDTQLQQEADGIRRGGRTLVVIDLACLLLVILLGGLTAAGVRAYLANLAKARQATSAAYSALQQQTDQLDETVRARTAALTAANGEIQRFAYIVSHDLRAPLINIMGFTSELEQATATLARHSAEDPLLPEPVRLAAAEDIPEALRFIRASTGKMDNLINAILKLSREGQRSLTPEPLDMGALVTTLFETLRHQSADVAITIGAMPVIVADRVAVEQIFGNICDNAVKYMAPGRAGTIRVTGAVEGAMARFEVADNGRGIAQRDLERVFELFRRAGDQTVQGDGIGLAHVRALVRRMGGSIVCTSTLGVGTTFTVHLPVSGGYAVAKPV